MECFVLHSPLRGSFSRGARGDPLKFCDCNETYVYTVALGVGAAMRSQGKVYAILVSAPRDKPRTGAANVATVRVLDLMDDAP